MSTSSEILKIEHLSWSIPDGAEVIRDLDLSLQSGKLIAVTGPNGGGKTSLAKLIAGLAQPSSGRILLNGADITALDITQRARLGIAFAFQQPVRFKGLTVRDLLELAAGGRLTDGELCALLGKVGLCANEYIHREMNASLSGGEAKRIEIATVLALSLIHIFYAFQAAPHSKNPQKKCSRSAVFHKQTKQQPEQAR